MRLCPFGAISEPSDEPTAHTVPGQPPRQTPVEATRALRPVCRDGLGPQLQQKQIGHDRHRHRVLDAISPFGNLVLLHAHDPFQCFEPQFHPPPAHIHARNRPRGDGLRPIGHED